MQRFFVLACVSLALASPVAAQEAAQPAPSAEQLPPPPPFPPMPSAKPSHRFVDVGGHARAHHASSARKARASHKASKGHKVTKGHKATRSAVHKEKAVHFSAKTVRSCHAMTYRQIMRSSSCRTMIKQELAAAPAHRTSHKASAHHKATVHKKAAKRRRR
jgi:hypothetical protein